MIKSGLGRPQMTEYETVHRVKPHETKYVRRVPYGRTWEDASELKKKNYLQFAKLAHSATDETKTTELPPAAEAVKTSMKPIGQKPSRTATEEEYRNLVQFAIERGLPIPRAEVIRYNVQVMVERVKLKEAIYEKVAIPEVVVV